MQEQNRHETKVSVARAQELCRAPGPLNTLVLATLPLSKNSFYFFHLDSTFILFAWLSLKCFTLFLPYEKAKGPTCFFSFVAGE